MKNCKWWRKNDDPYENDKQSLILYHVIIVKKIVIQNQLRS